MGYAHVVADFFALQYDSSQIVFIERGLPSMRYGSARAQGGACRGESSMDLTSTTEIDKQIAEHEERMQALKAARKEILQKERELQRKRAKHWTSIGHLVEDAYGEIENLDLLESWFGSTKSHFDEYAERYDEIATEKARAKAAEEAARKEAEEQVRAVEEKEARAKAEAECLAQEQEARRAAEARTREEDVLHTPYGADAVDSTSQSASSYVLPAPGAPDPACDGYDYPLEEYEPHAGPNGVGLLNSIVDSLGPEALSPDMQGNIAAQPRQPEAPAQQMPTQRFEILTTTVRSELVGDDSYASVDEFHEFVRATRAAAKAQDALAHGVPGVFNGGIMAESRTYGGAGEIIEVVPRSTDDVFDYFERAATADSAPLAADVRETPVQVKERIIRELLPGAGLEVKHTNELLMAASHGVSFEDLKMLADPMLSLQKVRAARASLEKRVGA